MANMDSWDITLLVIAGYLAVVTLVRLMARRRNQVFEEYRQRVEAERKFKAVREAAKLAAKENSRPKKTA